MCLSGKALKDKVKAEGWGGQTGGGNLAQFSNGQRGEVKHGKRGKSKATDQLWTQSGGVGETRTREEMKKKR